MLKSLLVYAHLLVTCVAIGSVLVADHKIWRGRHRKPDEAMLSYLGEVQWLISVALALLWLSGAALVLCGYIQDGPHYLLNEKLWAKVSVVLLLTANGVVLHRAGFPLIRRGPFVSLALRSRIRLALLGAVSTTSWLFAAYLGIARHWNHHIAFMEAMCCFVALLVLAVLAGFATVFGITLRRPMLRNPA